MLKILTEDDEEDEDDVGTGELPQTQEQRNSFLLSQSGTFKLQDFAVNKQGISASTKGSASSHTTAAVKSTVWIDVRSYDELEFQEEIGTGASSVVRRAVHGPSGQFVAVKQIQILEKTKRDQMVSELRIMRTHTCPWLVPLYNAFYEEATVSMVLEFMDGGSVATLVEKHANGGLRDESELAKIAVQMLNGVNYLHRQCHQVHRDLKPANVMLNAKGQVKISDFGISSQLDSTTGFCSTFVGTACYMAPERLSGASYSYASDIWSFGLIVLELALGMYPYGKTDNYFKLMANIMEMPPPGVPTEHFSDEFADLISCCLDKDQERRPPAGVLLKHQWLKGRGPPIDPGQFVPGMFSNLTLSEE